MVIKIERAAERPRTTPIVSVWTSSAPFSCAVFQVELTGNSSPPKSLRVNANKGYMASKENWTALVTVHGISMGFSTRAARGWINRHEGRQPPMDIRTHFRTGSRRSEMVCTASTGVHSAWAACWSLVLHGGGKEVRSKFERQDRTCTQTSRKP